MLPHMDPRLGAPSRARVAALHVEGKSAMEIATELGISRSKVYFHLKKIREAGSQSGSLGKEGPGCELDALAKTHG